MRVKKLTYNPLSHAVWTSYHDKTTGRELPGLAAVRYCRFNRKVKLKTIKIPPTILRWAPPVVSQPAHIQVAYFRGLKEGWKILLDKELPLYSGKKPHQLELDNVETDHLRIVCDREHPVPPSHGEQWANPYIVPFRILEKVECYGIPLEEKEYEPIYNSPLKVKHIYPAAPRGMKVLVEGHQVLYTSPFFSIGFSLRRPFLTHLGWDSLGKGFSEHNLIAPERYYERRPEIAPLDSGPFLSTLQGDIYPHFWSGEVEIEGNKVVYKRVHAVDELESEWMFDVHQKGVNICVTQRCRKKIHALEADAWRFVWDGTKSLTGTWGIPKQSTTTRTGVVPLPVRWSAPGHGTISIQSPSDAVLQVDSWRSPLKLGWAGFVIGAKHDEYGTLVINPGETHHKFNLKVESIKPAIKKSIKKNLPEGILRNWHSAFGFRPELAGISNNAISVNCHLCQASPTDMAAYTEAPKTGPSPIELARYTVTFALKGGPGYSDNRELYMDADPNLICAAGRIHQVAPNTDWLKEVWPFIRQAIERILATMDKQGLMVCKLLTGNSGSNRWSSNVWDVVGFGHYDAYSNAFGYRALRNGEALAKAVGDLDTFKRCSKAADRIRRAYHDCFFNPQTGWLGGWRSADGQLHDYGFTFVNAVAICFGLVDQAKAEAILGRLEKKREDMGLNYFYYGLPSNLLPIRREDQPENLGGKRADGLDKFGVYENGALTTIFAGYYLRALSMYNFKRTADLMCKHLNQSFATNRIIGGIGTHGSEFYTFEGRPCGYEGTQVLQFPVLLAMAQHWGLVEILKPEWWPLLNTQCFDSTERGEK